MSGIRRRFHHHPLSGHLHRVQLMLSLLCSDRKLVDANLAAAAHKALYSYTAYAPEGGISLASYPSIRTWIDRIEALRGLVAMTKTNVAA